MDKKKALNLFEFIGLKNHKYEIKKLEPSIHHKLSDGELSDFVKKYHIPTNFYYLKEMFQHDEEFVLREFYKKIEEDPLIFEKHGTNMFMKFLGIHDPHARGGKYFRPQFQRPYFGGNSGDVDRLFKSKKEIVDLIMNNGKIINSINGRTVPENPEWGYHEEYWFDHIDFIANVLSYSTDIPGDLKKFGNHGVEFVKFINDNKRHERGEEFLYVKSLLQHIKTVPMILKYFDSDIILISILRNGWDGLLYLEKLILIYPKTRILILNSEKVSKLLKERINGFGNDYKKVLPNIMGLFKSV